MSTTGCLNLYRCRVINPEMLLARLEAIGYALTQHNDALALIGLGSVGQERDRLDAFSDLDFFVIVEDDAKADYLDRLDWLAAVAPIAYSFRNTVDGYKLLYADGIFCEFAVFTQTELATAAFTAARVIWQRPNAVLPILQSQGIVQQEMREEKWLVGEALTNLSVGLGRMRRGEILSATRFIQHYAVDRVIELASRTVPIQGVHIDPFVPERRIEQRSPELAKLLPQFVQGYSYNRESALAILSFLETYFDVHPAMAHAIRSVAIDGMQLEM
jgi:lincosamide nucleotidyltransferase B/F